MLRWVLFVLFELSTAPLPVPGVRHAGGQPVGRPFPDQQHTKHLPRGCPDRNQESACEEGGEPPKFAASASATCEIARTASKFVARIASIWLGTIQSRQEAQRRFTDMADLVDTGESAILENHARRGSGPGHSGVLLSPMNWRRRPGPHGCSDWPESRLAFGCAIPRPPIPVPTGGLTVTAKRFFARPNRMRRQRRLSRQRESNS